MTGAELDLAILDAIRRGWGDPLTDAEFDSLALAVFRHQYDGIPAYARLCHARAKTPDLVRSWREVPLVPTDAFKEGPLCVSGGSSSDARVFETSGTTRGEIGRHYLQNDRLYRAGLLPTFRRFVLPDRERIRALFLSPSSRELPRSSLVFMLEALASEIASGAPPFLVSRGRLDLERLVATLRDAQRAREPLLVFGTSFAFVHAMDALDAAGLAFSLPPGSRIVDTGGTKGRSREIAREDLLLAYGRVFGVERSRVVAEYGMTELSSQFYDAHLALSVGHGTKMGPPWTRVRVLDPTTLEDLPTGQTGLLAFFDLANRSSIAAVVTGDLGRLAGSGVDFSLEGRAPGALPRGCSLALDDLLGRDRGAGSSPLDILASFD